jgi:hypothetical protein
VFFGENDGLAPDVKEVGVKFNTWNSPIRFMRPCCRSSDGAPLQPTT